jgi:alkylation response protein AidB-like acyl-CoA dehydrogenase
MPDPLASVAEMIPWMQSRAGALDRTGTFPADEIKRLRQAGALAPICGNAPVGTLASLLGRAGQGNLSVGPILEAHVNALHLIARYGKAVSWQDGQLFALWVTDPPENGLRMRQIGERIVLTGGKQFCSAAGSATGALVTARDVEGGTRMLVLPLGNGETITPLPSPLQGMRAAVTGAVDFTDCETSADALLGQPGDYLRERDFSTGV